MRFQFIDDHRDEFPVTLMCKVLQVSSSGYYAWYQRPPSGREMTNQELVRKIKAVYNENLGVYGSPRIYQELKRRGVACSENRVARLMRLRGVRAKQSKRFKTTTKRNKAHPAAPNLLKRNFEAERPDQKWLADITYIATRRVALPGRHPRSVHPPHCRLGDVASDDEWSDYSGPGDGSPSASARCWPHPPLGSGQPVH